MPQAIEPLPDTTADSTSVITTYSEVRYAGGVFTIDVDICSALFDYTLELTRGGRVDSVTLPSLVAGLRVASTVLLGPSSQLWCSLVNIAFVNIADERIVRDLRQRIDSLRPRALGVAHGDSTMSPLDDFDFEY